jgi:hypothetical protein
LFSLGANWENKKKITFLLAKKPACGKPFGWRSKKPSESALEGQSRCPQIKLGLPGGALRRFERGHHESVAILKPET